MRLPSNKTARGFTQGFTLVELIVVITITSILAAVASAFIANPTQSYFDMEARATLTDLADGALRRMARSLEGALPNSVRVTTNSADSMIEFVPIKIAGRYRAEAGTPDTNSPDDPLDFSAAADSFDVLGPSIGGQVTPGTDQIVIFNLGVPGADVYEGSNRRAFTALTNDAWTETHISFSGGAFPFASPSSRFYFVGKPTSFACDMTNGKLLRYDNYAYQASQPGSIATLSSITTSYSTTLLADKLSYCKITYANNNQRNGIVTITLGFTNNGANVRLMHQVRVVNSP